VAEAARALTLGGNLSTASPRPPSPSCLDLQRHADLVISSDTGPAHLAIGLGTPTIVIVGGGHFTALCRTRSELTPPQVRFVWHENGVLPLFLAVHPPHALERSYPCLDAVSVAQVSRYRG